jgi:hypothetical protein
MKQEVYTLMLERLCLFFPNNFLNRGLCDAIESPVKRLWAFVRLYLMRHVHKALMALCVRKFRLSSGLGRWFGGRLLLHGHGLT